MSENLPKRPREGTYLFKVDENNGLLYFLMVYISIK